MPLYRKVNEKGYELTFSHDDSRWHYTHWLSKVSQQSKPADIERPVLHHVDFCKLNNAPDNLEYMTWEDHRDLHAALAYKMLEAWNGTPEQRAHSSRLMKRLHKIQPERMIEIATTAGHKAWADAQSDPERLAQIEDFIAAGHSPEARAKALASLHEHHNSITGVLQHAINGSNAKRRWKKERRQASTAYKRYQRAGRKLGGKASNQLQAAKFGREVLETYKKVNRQTWDALRKQYDNVAGGSRTLKDGTVVHFERNFNRKPHYDTALAAFDNDNAALREACANYNHKVVSVKRLTRREDVYCLTVPQYENFALESGVFVHNCTAHGITGALRYLMIKTGHGDFEMARLQLYYDERVIENTVNSDSGAEIRDGIKCAATFGVAHETVWPYIESKFKLKPPIKVYNDAKKFEALKYERVQVSAEAVKTVLADGYPVIIGLTVYEEFESDEVAQTGIVPMPTPQSETIGGHCLYCTGYGQKPGYFTVRNSWDTDWGDRGLCYFPEEYLGSTDYGSDYWAVTQLTPVSK